MYSCFFSVILNLICLTPLTDLNIHLFYWARWNIVFTIYWGWSHSTLFKRNSFWSLDHKGLWTFGRNTASLYFKNKYLTFVVLLMQKLAGFYLCMIWCQSSGLLYCQHKCMLFFLCRFLTGFPQEVRSEQVLMSSYSVVTSNMPMNPCMVSEHEDKDVLVPVWHICVTTEMQSKSEPWGCTRAMESVRLLDFLSWMKLALCVTPQWPLELLEGPPEPMTLILRGPELGHEKGTRKNPFDYYEDLIIYLFIYLFMPLF